MMGMVGMVLLIKLDHAQPYFRKFRYDYRRRPRNKSFITFHSYPHYLPSDILILRKSEAFFVHKQ